MQRCNNNKLTDCNSYVFDVYVSEDNTIKLIELNDFNHATDPCLFDWTEIENKPFIFRYKQNNIINEINYQTKN